MRIRLYFWDEDDIMDDNLNNNEIILTWITMFWDDNVWYCNILTMFEVSIFEVVDWISEEPFGPVDDVDGGGHG